MRWQIWGYLGTNLDIEAAKMPIYNSITGRHSRRKERIMKKKMTADEKRNLHRREAMKRKIFEEEGFTEAEIMFMSKKARHALLEKYGLR